MKNDLSLRFSFLHLLNYILRSVLVGFNVLPSLDNLSLFFKAYLVSCRILMDDLQKIVKFKTCNFLLIHIVLIHIKIIKIISVCIHHTHKKLGDILLDGIIFILGGIFINFCWEFYVFGWHFYIYGEKLLIFGPLNF